MPGQIKFKSLKGEYGFMSNFARYSLEDDGKIYQTMEHYFQSKKFDNLDHAEKIRNARTPKQAKNLGRSRSYPLKKDWDNIRNIVMFEGCLKKFEQNDEFRKKMLETGDAIIIESSNKDSYWGDGPKGTGKNMLGKTLMKVRDRLRSEYQGGQSSQSKN